ncbi:MAG: hypothetical protein JRN52_05310 [Nitrososphaerota archaeon]|nr:hypothetical protein [Nitrososphaerota archaeon]
MAYNFRKLIGKRTLIVGEVHSGKTRLMSKLLSQAIKLYPNERILVLDFAPNIKTKTGKVGSKLRIPAAKNIFCLAPEHVYAPRLEGQSAREVLMLAKKNKEQIDRLLKIAHAKIVFLNDVTLYLHSGRATLLMRLAGRSETFVANGYKGKLLIDDKGSGISLHESIELDCLAEKMDLVIQLGRTRRSSIH